MTVQCTSCINSLLCSPVLVPHIVGGVIRVPEPAPATTTNLSVQRPVAVAGCESAKFTRSIRIWQISVPRLLDKKSRILLHQAIAS